MWCERWPSRLALGAMYLGALGASGYGKGFLPALPVIAIAAALGGKCGGQVIASETSGASWWKFVRTWCALLGRLGALAGAARAVAATLDALAGGRAHRWLFGAPPLPPAAEPWPDPLAVAALALLCLMFMCGLENSSALTIILMGSVVSGVVFFISVCIMAADVSNWQKQTFFPEGINGVILAAGCCAYAFPEAIPTTDTNTKKLKYLALIMAPFFSMLGVGTAYCMVGEYRKYADSVVPFVQVFESHEPHWARPFVASFTIVALALAMTEILPQAVSTLVMMAGPEWKVLTKVITYESSTTGSQVLAVFSAGSLSAILAFACPLGHLIKLTCASQVLIWVLEAATLLHIRCQPEQQIEDPTDVRYKRLAGTQSRPISTHPTRGTKLAAGFWFLPRSVRQNRPAEPQRIIKTTGINDERECLLLDEYGVARVSTGDSDHSEQTDLSDHGEALSSEGESSTDIDAVVKEYKDRITVVSSVPDSSGTMGIPSAASGKRGTAGAVIIITASFVSAIGITLSIPIIVYIAIPIVFGGGLLVWWQPARPGSAGVISCTICALICSILATPLLADAWPAFILFTCAGYIMYVRRTAMCGGNVRRHRAPPLLGPRPARITHLDTVYIAR